MIDSSQAELQKLIIHRVGNKSADEGYKLSDKPVDLHQQPDLGGVLTKYFLTPLAEVPFYRFAHVTSLDLNEVHSVVRKIFEAPKNFARESKELGKLLYESSVHPKIRNGELYVAYFRNCLYEGKSVEAVGIFKSETRDTFLKLGFDGHDYAVGYDEGINVSKLDKGCLVLDVNGADGYVVAVVDNTSKGNEAVYWKDEFLKLQPAADEYHATRNYLDVCRNFVTNQLEQEYEVSKTDKIGFLNKTVDYFKSNDAFEEDSFLETVFADKDVISSFNKYKDEYQQEKGIELDEAFGISAPAVRKQARVFKSVLKLDKNFHVYIHGDRSLIEKGYDDQVGKSYYKIYFDEEA